MAEFILNILQAYHQATTPELVVSAFEQVGNCSRASADNNLARRETFVDPTRARLVIAETSLYRHRAPVPNPGHRQLRIADLNSFVQSQMAPPERQPDRRGLPPTPTSRPPAPSQPPPHVPPQDRRPLLPVGFSSAFRPVRSLFPTALSILTFRTFAQKPPTFGPRKPPEPRPASLIIDLHWSFLFIFGSSLFFADQRSCLKRSRSEQNPTS